MFIQGLEHVMHESRTFPRFLPRIGKNITCTYGKPIDEALIQPYIDSWNALREKEADRDQAEWLDGGEAQAIRRDLTKVIRDAVVQLRLEAGFPAEHPDAHRAEFYDSAEGLKYDELSGIPRPEIFRKKAAPKQQQKVYEKEGPT